jgi:hypothetical protein
LCSDEERGYLRDIEKLTRLAVRQLHVQFAPMKPYPRERIESEPARDLRARGFKTSGQKRPGGSGRGARRAGKITPSSAAASPVRRSGRARSGPAPA